MSLNALGWELHGPTPAGSVQAGAGEGSRAAGLLKRKTRGGKLRRGGGRKKKYLPLFSGENTKLLRLTLPSSAR